MIQEQVTEACTLDQMAEELFTLMLMGYRERIQSRSDSELSESQLLTLDLLTRSKVLTVGHLQRAIGVLPAQMSRIIRALETGAERPLIKCTLNPADKRKIDVTVTPEGAKLWDQFREARLARSRERLGVLSERDRAEFIRICKVLRGLEKSEGS